MIKGWLLEKEKFLTKIFSGLKFFLFWYDSQRENIIKNFIIENGGSVIKDINLTNLVYVILD